jgi:hypothetical protein
VRNAQSIPAFHIAARRTAAGDKAAIASEDGLGPDELASHGRPGHAGQRRRCRDTEVDGTPWTAVTARYSVRSRTEFIGTTPFEKAAYWYCKQSDLPEPWRTTNLRSVSVR